MWRHGGLQGGGLQKCRAGIEVPGKKVPWAINPQLKPQEHVRIPTIGEEDARFFDELREGPETRGARNDGHGDIGVKVPRLQVEQGLCLLFAGTHTKDGNLGECTWALQHDVADYIRLHYSHYSRDRTLQCFFCCCTQLSPLLLSSLSIVAIFDAGFQLQYRCSCFRRVRSSGVAKAVQLSEGATCA